MNFGHVVALAAPVLLSISPAFAQVKPTADLRDRSFTCHGLGVEAQILFGSDGMYDRRMFRERKLTARTIGQFASTPIDDTTTVVKFSNLYGFEGQSRAEPVTSAAHRLEFRNDELVVHQFTGPTAYRAVLQCNVEQPSDEALLELRKSRANYDRIVSVQNEVEAKGKEHEKDAEARMLKTRTEAVWMVARGRRDGLCANPAESAERLIREGDREMGKLIDHAALMSERVGRKDAVLPAYVFGGATAKYQTAQTLMKRAGCEQR